MLRMGYACQNLTLPASTGHTLRLAAIANQAKLRGVIETNLQHLERILHWNAEHRIHVFRLSQQLIPFASHPTFPYDWESVHASSLARVAALGREFGARLSLHPGQFVVPGSPRLDVVAASLAELRYCARLLDIVGSTESTLVLHLGGAYEDRAATLHRFVEVLRPERDILRYLVLENDERIWTIAEAVEAASALGIPAVLDTLHHRLNPGRLTLQKAADLALATWNRRPKLHISTQAPEKMPGAHAWGINLKDWRTLEKALAGREADVMIEAKGKDQALLALRDRLKPAAV